MTTTSNIEKIAFAISKCPGSYALLLGSGMSRSAGIITGYEVTLDLIQKIPKDCEIKLEELEQWYRDKYENEEPLYDNVLARLSSKQIERRNILNDYFEPSETDTETGMKIPQPGHYAIADLVKSGHIKVILTTNFDRLIESAIIEKGIQPYVIHNRDSFQSCLPPVHIKNSCIICKIHGDYRDAQILNTTIELSEYIPETSHYLEKIIEDFGLVIVGWSSSYDIALSDIIINRKNGLFELYWALRDEKDPKNVESAEKLRALTVKIQDADQFFEELRDTIYAIDTAEEINRPISANVAVGRIKQYIAQGNHVKIHDFVNQELAKVHSILSSSKFEVDSNKIERGVNTDELAKSRITDINQLMKPLLGMIAAITFFDNFSSTHLIETVARKITHIRKWGQVTNDIRDLQYYPFFLLISVIGIVSFLSNRYESLSALLYRMSFTHENIRGTIVRESPLLRCNIQDVGYTYNRIIVDNYLEIENYLLNEILNQYVGSEFQLREIFLKFKYLVACVYVDTKNIDNNVFIKPQDMDNYLEDIWILINLLSPKDLFGKSNRDISLTNELYKEAYSYYNEHTAECNWPPLNAGMFLGKFERFQKSANIVHNELSPKQESKLD